MLSREHKLALIIGFAMTLAVSVLLSDHFSAARHAALPDVDGSEPPEQPARAAPLLRVAEVQPDPIFAPPTASATGSAPSPREPEPKSTPAPASEEAIAARSPVVLEPKPTKAAAQAARGEEQRPILTPVPPAVVTIFQGSLGSPSSDEPPTYRVRAGDRLYAIAELTLRDGKRWREIQRLNPGLVGPEGEITPGDLLVLPDDAILRRAAAPASTPARAAEPRPYTVRAGETLSEIASRELGSAKRWREIRDADGGPIDDPARVQAGSRVLLPGG